MKQAQDLPTGTWVKLEFLGRASVSQTLYVHVTFRGIQSAQGHLCNTWDKRSIVRMLEIMLDATAMTEIMLCQTLQMSIAKDVQKIQSSDLPKWRALWCYVIFCLLFDQVPFNMVWKIGCWYFISYNNYPRMAESHKVLWSKYCAVKINDLLTWNNGLALMGINDTLRHYM